MKILIKRNKRILGKENIIKFIYDVELEQDKMGFKNFDIGNEEELINSLLTNLTDEFFVKLNKPLYLALSIYFFSNIKKVNEISYENEDYVSIVNKKDILWFLILSDLYK